MKIYLFFLLFLFCRSSHPFSLGFVIFLYLFFCFHFIFLFFGFLIFDEPKVSVYVMCMCCIIVLPFFLFAFPVVNKCPFIIFLTFPSNLSKNFFTGSISSGNWSILLWLLLENASWRPPSSFSLGWLFSSAAQPLSFEFLLIFFLDRIPSLWGSHVHVFLDLFSFQIVKL